jgi:glycosyltransferase involved in cell wall biosynthesis
LTSPLPLPLRVTLVITQLGLGGTERQLVLLAEGLRTLGVDVDVVALYDGGPRLPDLVALGVPVRVLGMRRPPRRPLRFVSGSASLVRHLRNRRPDVVHAFLFDAYVLACPLARAAGVPVVVAGRRALSDYKAGRRVARRMERVSSRAVDLVVANAQAVASDVIATEGVQASDVVVIPNALPSRGVVAATGSDGGSTVLCVANLWRYKGHHDLLRAVALLRERGVEIRLLLVGDGPERSEIERLVAEQDLPVQLLGAREDVPELLARSDVFVLPSHTEGMNNALMEAVAAGLPVVATDVGGNPDVVGAGGLLCPPRRPDLMADELEEVLREPSTRARLREAGLLQAATWTVDALARRHLDEYGKVLARRCAA